MDKKNTTRTAPRRKSRTTMSAGKKNSATNPAKSHAALKDNGPRATSPGTYSTEADRIRAVFLDRKPVYAIDEAAQLFGVSRSELLRVGDEIAYVRQGHLTFEDLITVAVTRWSSIEIEDALGRDADDILPPNLVPVCIELRLPSYLAVAVQNESFRLSKLHGRRVTVNAAAEALLQQLFDEDWRPVEYLCERFNYGHA